MTRIVLGALIREGRVLLVRRRPDREAGPGQWDLPGGHVETGESGLDGRRREMAEELGVQIDAASALHLLQWSGESAPDVVFDAWLVRDWQGTPSNTAPEEHDLIEFCSGEQLPPLAHLLRSSLQAASRNPELPA